MNDQKATCKAKVMTAACFPKSLRDSALHSLCNTYGTEFVAECIVELNLEGAFMNE